MTAVLERGPEPVVEVPHPARGVPSPQVTFADVVAGLALLSALLLALGVSGPFSAAVFGATLLLSPGAMWCDVVKPRDWVERALVTVGLSVVSWMVVADVLLTFRLWHPRQVAQALLIGLVGFHLVRRQTDARRQLPTVRERSPRVVWLSGWEMLTVFASLALWAISLRRIDLDAIGDWGLVSALPITWFAALLIAVLTAARAASAAVTSGRRLAVTMAPVLIIIYATMPMIATTIRYPWSYKHIGVVRLLDTTGRLHPEVDIYNNFSGFFGIGALLRGVTGTDPTSYAAWFQLGAEVFVLLAVWLLVQRCTDSVRVAHIATLIYLLTNWVGQNYFAPQTFGTFFGLATLGLCFSWFASPDTTRIPIVGGLLRQLSPHSPPVVSSTTRWHRRVVIGALFLGLMMSHPLTPAAIVGTIVASWIAGWMRDKLLLTLLGVVGVFWLATCWQYFAANSFDLGFGGSMSQNAAGNAVPEAAVVLPAGVSAVGTITRLFSVGVWALGVVGVGLCLWAMRRVGVLLIAALVPFAILVVQSYGGEAIYRVYLFSLPLMAGLIALALVNSSPVQTRTFAPQLVVRTSVLAVTLATGFMIAHFGREQINLVDPSEVAMEEWIARNVDDPALIAQFGDTYPSASTARYPSLQINDTYTPYVVTMLDRSDTLPDAAELDDVADDLLALTPGTPYVVIGPGMINSLRAQNRLPIESTAEAAAFLSSNDHFTFVHRIEDTWLFAVTEIHKE